MKESILYALASALFTAAVILAPQAKAQTVVPDTETYVSYVQTSDLDLGSSSGERRLKQRLAHAAREVCGTASAVDLQGRNAVRECRAQAIARASSRRDELLARRGAVIAVTATR